MTYNINMKFAYLFLILLLAVPSFANSKYDVDLSYAAENFTAQELDEYFTYQNNRNPVYHRPSNEEIKRQAREIVKKGNGPENNIMFIHRLPGGSFYVNY